MAEKLVFQYDQVGDILYINKCAPYAAQESEEIGDEMIARLNPVSGEVENLEILFFSKRLNADFLLELPEIANLRLAAS
ncbi:DUF2283 domain-containing protein [filamentous cyanobacterium CCP3]|nr:DUF2283 domain-containing protein [filamentous cyanobacterium CCP3]